VWTTWQRIQLRWIGPPDLGILDTTGVSCWLPSLVSCSFLLEERDRKLEFHFWIHSGALESRSSLDITVLCWGSGFVFITFLASKHWLCIGCCIFNPESFSITRSRRYSVHASITTSLDPEADPQSLLITLLQWMPCPVRLLWILLKSEGGEKCLEGVTLLDPSLELTPVGGIFHSTPISPALCTEDAMIDIGRFFCFQARLSGEGDSSMNSTWIPLVPRLPLIWNSGCVMLLLTLPGSCFVSISPSLDSGASVISVTRLGTCLKGVEVSLHWCCNRMRFLEAASLRWVVAKFGRLLLLTGTTGGKDPWGFSVESSFVFPFLNLFGSCGKERLFSNGNPQRFFSFEFSVDSVELRLGVRGLKSFGRKEGIMRTTEVWYDESSSASIPLQSKSSVVNTTSSGVVSSRRVVPLSDSRGGGAARWSTAVKQYGFEVKDFS